MDPISAAGLGLGATSLLFQLFSGCIKSYQLLLDVADMPKNFEHLRVRMRLEQIRLLHWGDKIGLLQDALEAPSSTLQLHHNLIFDILYQVSRFFVECIKIHKKSLPTMTSNTSGQEVLKPTAELNVYGQSATTLFAKATRVLHRTSELPNRLAWAIIRQEKFEKLVEQLISYNNSMLSLLDSTSLQQIDQAQRQSELTLLQLSRDVESLKILVRAVRIEPIKDETASFLRQMQALPHIPNPPNRSTALDNTQLDLGQLAVFKADNLICENPGTGIDDVKIDASDIHITESTSRIDLATFRDEMVWIEWKEFDQHNLNPWYQNMLENRVKRLTALLRKRDTPIEFRGPACLGYVQEMEDNLIRYGFINRVPAFNYSTEPPRSLLDLVRHEKSPSLTKRIRLGSLLANSLMHLHAVNWLHKGVRSDNIIFFPGPHNEANYEAPTLSGFEFSRPDEPGEMTEKPESNLEHDMYSHPYSIDHPRARSRKSWDIYSLGIVLVEIATWKSIDKFLEIDLKTRQAKSRVRRIRETLLQGHFLHEIEISCGAIYCEVVRRCVTGGQDIGMELDADESDPSVGSEMIRVFSQEIVDALGRIRV